MIKFTALCLVLSLMFVAGSAHVAEYLLSYPGDTTIRAVAGYSGGWYQVQSQPRVNISNYGHVHDEIYESYPLAGRPEGSDNQTILMIANHVYLYVGTGNSVYSPLGTYALGKKYIMSSCNPTTGYNTMLVVATHNFQTDVEITFKVDGTVTYDGNTYGNGDTLTKSLAENQTFWMETGEDLTGTVVVATQTVAVFSGLTYTANGMKHIVGYDQLLPVMHYGMEYVIAVDDHSTNYDLQVFADHDQTDLQFKSGNTITVNAGGMYNDTLGTNEALHFTSTKPVMATLCRLNALKSGFTVVPPVAFYPTSRSLYVDQGDTAKILIKKTDMDPRMQINETEMAHFTWTNITNSEYQVGTLDFPDAGSYGTINSNYTFIVMVYGENRIYNAGASIPRPVTETTQQTTETTTAATGKGYSAKGMFTLPILMCVIVFNHLC